MERNYDFDGAGTTSGGEFIKILPPSEKNGDIPYFEMPDGEKVGFIQGYLDEIIVREALEPNGKIPERNEYVLKMSIPYNGNIKQFRVGFSDHWKNPTTAAVCNAVAGAVTAGVDGLKINLYSKEGPSGFSMRASVRHLNSEDFIEPAFPWNESESKYDGVPRSDEQGNYEEEKAFWLDLMKKMAAKKNGAPVPVTAKASKADVLIKKIQEAGVTGLDGEKIQNLCNRAKKWIDSQNGFSPEDVTTVEKFIIRSAEGSNQFGEIQNWIWKPKPADDLPF